MKFVYPPTSLSLRGSPNHGPGSERVGPLQNAKSQHMRVPGFRAEGQPITGEGQEPGRRGERTVLVGAQRMQVLRAVPMSDTRYAFAIHAA